MWVQSCKFEYFTRQKVSNYTQKRNRWVKLLKRCQIAKKQGCWESLLSLLYWGWIHIKNSIEIIFWEILHNFDKYIRYTFCHIFAPAGYSCPRGLYVFGVELRNHVLPFSPFLLIELNLKFIFMWIHPTFYNFREIPIFC